MTTTNKAVSYRVRVDDTHNPRGPDGQGWNRLSIVGIGSHDRCTLMPITRQGALDTLRGMARYGVPTAYSDCINNATCCQCPVATKQKDKWQDAWHIREDAKGHVWLLGNVEKGFSGFGHCYKNWAALMSDVEVPMLKRMSDRHGLYWIATDTTYPTPNAVRTA